jgi:hypothetical protein
MAESVCEILDSLLSNGERKDKFRTYHHELRSQTFEQSCWSLIFQQLCQDRNARFRRIKRFILDAGL